MLAKPRAISFHVNNDYKNLMSRSTTMPAAAHLIKPFMSLEVINPDSKLIRGHDELSTSSDAGTAVIIMLLSGAAEFNDLTHKNATLEESDVLWILAGSGIKYSIRPKTQNFIGIKLRIALSPALECAPAQSACLSSNLVERDGPARILLGQSGNAYSQWALPALINYLAVTLKAGQTWSYEPPINHRTAWIAVINGKINSSNMFVSTDEIAVYESSNKSIHFLAEEDSIFLLGSSQEYAQDLTLEKYPVPGFYEACGGNKSEVSSAKVFMYT